jgi:hypothetical protein
LRGTKCKNTKKPIIPAIRNSKNEFSKSIENKDSVGLKIFQNLCKKKQFLPKK